MQKLRTLFVAAVPIIIGTWSSVSVQATTQADCCYGKRGNINGSPMDSPDLSDLSLLISYLTTAAPNRPNLPCFLEADVNADGRIDVSDLSCFIGAVLHVYTGATCPADCPIE